MKPNEMGVNSHQGMANQNKEPAVDTDRRIFRARLILLAVFFISGFSVVSARLIDFGLLAGLMRVTAGHATPKARMGRPNILDRHGRILATDIETASLFADTRKLLDIDEAVEQLSPILKNLPRADLRKRLTRKRAFVWLKRELSPRQEAAIHNLGIPGLGFVRESRRVYPTGRAAAHILGHVNVDNQGIAGIEKYVDSISGPVVTGGAGFSRKPVVLSVDLNVQHALRDELQIGLEKFQAKAAAGLVLNVMTGEVVALSSLPDYDPNRPGTALDETRINRLLSGVYELGSTFKVVTVAMALDLGTVTLETTFDARKPIRVGKFTINDFHGQRRILTVSEIFLYSSNIGAAKMAMSVGVARHKAFLKKLGLLNRLNTELPENAKPIYPKNWKPLNTMTIGFGHGLSVTPLQLAAAGAALVNGGLYLKPTFLKRDRIAAIQHARRVIGTKTSAIIRSLMVLNVTKGTARKAGVEGFSIGGKTGTAEKVVNGRYSKSALLTSFMGMFPGDYPQYLVLVMLDEPKPNEQTKGHATSGWNAVPVAGAIIKRIAPLLGVLPSIRNVGVAGVRGGAVR